MESAMCERGFHLVLIKRDRLKLPLFINTPHCQQTTLDREAKEHHKQIRLMYK